MRRPALFVGLWLGGCQGEVRPAARPRDVVEARPAFPTLSLASNARNDCFPADYRATRVRRRGDRVELCGLVGSRPSCYLIDPITTAVERAEVADAPRDPVESPAVEAPFGRTEARARGGSASTRGGSLALSYGSTVKTIAARTAAVSTLANAVIAPWSDGWFITLIGVRAPDLGATAIMEPSTGRLHGHAAIEPCAP